MFKRGQVVRYRGASREKGIVLATTNTQVVVCTFPRRGGRKPAIANYGTGALDVIGTTKKVPAACSDALTQMHAKAFERFSKPKKRRR